MARQRKHKTRSVRSPHGPITSRAGAAGHSVEGPPSERSVSSSRASRRGADAPHSEQDSERFAPSSRRFAPPDVRSVPPYSGVGTFLRLPLVSAEPIPAVDVLLFGVPFDGSTRFRGGARFGPRAVRDASGISGTFSAALGVDVFDELAVADGGDVVMPGQATAGALENISDRAEMVLRSGAVGGFIGGDQCVTLGVLRGIHRAKLRAVGLLHFDCRSDAALAPGDVVSHHTVIRQAVSECLVRPDRVLQIGVRGPFESADELAFGLSSGFEIVKVDDVRWDLHSVVSLIRRFVSAGPVYVSVDMNVLDPSFAPGTTSPSIGGMSTWELQQLLRALVGADILGFDIVELAPTFDPTGISALAAANVVQEILSAIADTRRSARPAPSSRASRGRRLSP
jgi:agmatinase